MALFGSQADAEMLTRCITEGVREGTRGLQVDGLLRTLHEQASRISLMEEQIKVLVFKVAALEDIA